AAVVFDTEAKIVPHRDQLDGVSGAREPDPGRDADGRPAGEWGPDARADLDRLELRARPARAIVDDRLAGALYAGVVRRRVAVVARAAHELVPAAVARRAARDALRLAGRRHARLRYDGGE